MEVTPCLGIGDLLTLKAIAMTNHLDIAKINLSQSLIKAYRHYPERFTQFIQKFIRLLFPMVQIEIVTREHQPIAYQPYVYITPYIYNHVTIPITDTPQTPYIVFHTKVRLDTNQATFMRNDLKLLESALESFKTDKTIIIMGEREWLKNVLNSEYFTLCQFIRH